MKTKTYIKRYLKDDLILLAVFGALVFLPQISMAQEDDSELRPKHQRILNHFDKDGDGQLNDREAFHARHFYNRWKNSHGPSDRPHVRPDRVRPDVRPDHRPDRIRPDRVRPDVRPDHVRPDVRRDHFRPDVRRDRIRDVRPGIDRNNDRRIGPREQFNARRIQARRAR